MNLCYFPVHFKPVLLWSEVRGICEFAFSCAKEECNWAAVVVQNGRDEEPTLIQKQVFTCPFTIPYTLQYLYVWDCCFCEVTDMCMVSLLSVRVRYGVLDINYQSTGRLYL
jgi:hypothetical protein